MEKSEEAVGLAYFMKWQTPVCALIIAIPAGIAVNLVKKRLSKIEEPLNYSDLWVPCWRKLNPRWLLGYRVMAFLTMAWLLFQMALFSGLFAFYFYTQWTFALVMLYFAVGIIISAQGCLRSSEKSQTETGERDTFLINGSEDRKSAATSNSRKERSRNNLHKHNSDDEPFQKAGFLGSSMHIIYQTSAGASVLTDLVFWTILVPMMAGKQFELTLLIGSIHSVNAIFLAIDSLLNALPFEWFGLTYFMLWSITYVTFQWILHACGFTWWPYPFLELSTPWAPLWYLGLAVIHVPCYGVYILLVKAKNAIFSKLFPRAFVRSHEQKRC